MTAHVLGRNQSPLDPLRIGIPLCDAARGDKVMQGCEAYPELCDCLGAERRFVRPPTVRVPTVDPNIWDRQCSPGTRDSALQTPLLGVQAWEASQPSKAVCPNAEHAVLIDECKDLVLVGWIHCQETKVDLSRRIGVRNARCVSVRNERSVLDPVFTADDARRFRKFLAYRHGALESAAELLVARGGEISFERSEGLSAQLEDVAKTIALLAMVDHSFLCRIASCRILCDRPLLRSRLLRELGLVDLVAFGRGDALAHSLELALEASHV